MSILNYSCIPYFLSVSHLQNFYFIQNFIFPFTVQELEAWTSRSQSNHWAVSCFPQVWTRKYFPAFTCHFNIICIQLPQNVSIRMTFFSNAFKPLWKKRQVSAQSLRVACVELLCLVVYILFILYRHLKKNKVKVVQEAYILIKAVAWLFRGGEKKPAQHF